MKYSADKQVAEGRLVKDLIDLCGNCRITQRAREPPDPWIQCFWTQWAALWSSHGTLVRGVVVDSNGVMYVFL